MSAVRQTIAEILAPFHCPTFNLFRFCFSDLSDQRYDGLLL